MLRSLVTASVMLALSAVCTTSFADGDVPQPTAHRRSVEALEKIARIGSGFEFKAWVNDDRGSPIGLGHELQYHFQSAKRSSLLVIHVDSAGKGTLLFPNEIGIDNRLEPNNRLDFPAEDAAFVLKAGLPTGVEFVLALATPKSITASDLGIASASESFAIVQPDDVPAVAQRIEALFRAVPQAERAADGFELSITEYDKEEIITVFTQTRSVAPMKLDVHLHFESGRHSLLPASHTELDVFADALNDASMRGKVFVVGGHTDDVGESDMNMRLSRRRAEEVVRYLTDVKGIDPARFRVRAYGEERPSQRGFTREARRLNRRVEFELDRAR